MGEQTRSVIDEAPAEEKKKKPKLRHFQHPTDPTIGWCGTTSPNFGFRTGDDPFIFIDCPMCADLRRRFPGLWWWNTHNMYYESRCFRDARKVVHNCAAAFSGEES